MNILVTDHSPLVSLAEGSVLIARNLFPRLRRHRLTLLCCAAQSDFDGHRKDLLRIFDEVHVVPRDRSLETLRGIVEGRLRSTMVRPFEQRLRQLVASQRFDVIHNRGLTIGAVAAQVPHAARLLELIDSETLFAKREACAVAPRAWIRYPVARFLETVTVRQFGICTTVAQADAEVIRRLAPQTGVHVIPNGVDAQRFAPMPIPENPDTMIFTGSMSFPPNIRAVQYFYEQVFPLIRRERPHARFIVAGRDPSAAISALASDPHVTITGAVDDLRPWLAQACVVVCPMVSGSGIKNKLLEALAMARPTVSTPLGAEALAVRDRRELRIAGDPTAFASAVVSLLNSFPMRRVLGLAGRQFVLQNHTWDAAASRYDALYQELSANRI